jgi:hypothetical protein
MEGPGLVPAIAIAVLTSLAGWGIHLAMVIAADGRPNHAVGIRLPALMRSEDAWREGHRAAAAWTGRCALWSTGLAAVSIVANGNGIAYLVGMGASVLTLATPVVGASIIARSRTSRSDAC